MDAGQTEVKETIWNQLWTIPLVSAWIRFPHKELDLVSWQNEDKEEAHEEMEDKEDEATQKPPPVVSVPKRTDTQAKYALRKFVLSINKIASSIGK